MNINSLINVKIQRTLPDGLPPTFENIFISFCVGEIQIFNTML